MIRWCLSHVFFTIFIICRQSDCRGAGAGGLVMGRGTLGGGTAMILLQQLQIGYQGQSIAPVLHGEFHRGSMTAVIGDNGCGKSTLLKTLVGALQPVSGCIRWRDGKRPRIAWLLQTNELDRQFPLRVQDVVAMGCWPQLSLFSSLRRQQSAIDQTLERVGLTAMRHEPIETLSGGQFQRMLFARLLMQKAQLVLLDEPFTGVDEETSHLLMAVINEMHQQQITVIAVLHDQLRVMRNFPEILHLTAHDAFWGATEHLPVPPKMAVETDVRTGKLWRVK